MTTSPDNSPEKEWEIRRRVKLAFLNRHPSLRFIPPDLKQQALKDLSKRARGGIAVYLPVWLFLSYWYDIPARSPSLFWINTTILTLLVIIRLFHLRWTATKAEQHTRALYNSLVLLLLINALHWGVLTAWLLSHFEFVDLHHNLMILLPAFALGGTVTLSISRIARILYPTFIYSPTFISILMVDYPDEYIMLAALAVFSMLYIMRAAHAIGNDYWAAVNAHRAAVESARQLEQLSTTDALTLIDNRLSFKKRYFEEWKRCSRYGINLCVLMIDLDKLKQINDSYGHLFGDDCLRAVAMTLRSNVTRETDIVARYGGDEFVALLPGADLKDAEVIADKLVKQTAAIRIFHDGEAVPLSCSVGIACAIPGKDDDVELLIRSADSALYQAKANGRNQWVSV